MSTSFGLGCRYGTKSVFLTDGLVRGAAVERDRAHGGRTDELDRDGFGASGRGGEDGEDDGFHFGFSGRLCRVLLQVSKVAPR